MVGIHGRRLRSMGFPFRLTANCVNSEGVNSTGTVVPEKGTTDMDLQPLLDILSKVSMGRVLPYAEQKTEGDYSIANIPVKALNPGDKTDLALRRFAADWFKTRLEKTATDTRFEKLKGLSWFTEKKEEIPIVGRIIISWWPRPEIPEFEQLLAQQRLRREAARRGENDE